MLEFENKSDAIRNTILALLDPEQSHLDLRAGGADASVKLLDAGLIDSKNLLDIILEIETRCGVRFNPEYIDFEQGITLGSLITAFDPVGA